MADSSRNGFTPQEVLAQVDRDTEDLKPNIEPATPERPSYIRVVIGQSTTVALYATMNETTANYLSEVRPEQVLLQLKPIGTQESDTEITWTENIRNSIVLDLPFRNLLVGINRRSGENKDDGLMYLRALALYVIAKKTGMAAVVSMMTSQGTLSTALGYLLDDNDFVSRLQAARTNNNSPIKASKRQREESPEKEVRALQHNNNKITGDTRPKKARRDTRKDAIRANSAPRALPTTNRVRAKYLDQLILDKALWEALTQQHGEKEALWQFLLLLFNQPFSGPHSLSSCFQGDPKDLNWLLSQPIIVEPAQQVHRWCHG